MTLNEIYTYYSSNWVKVGRALNVGSTTLQIWRRQGYIPLRYQKKIETRTGGLFKAHLSHSME